MSDVIAKIDPARQGSATRPGGGKTHGFFATEPEDLPVRGHWFQELAAGCPGTAAEHLPLVMWEDLIYQDRLVREDMRPYFLEVLDKKDRANDGIALCEKTIFRHYDFQSLYIVRRGRGTHIIDGVPYGIARGDVYVMGLGMDHHFSGCDLLLSDTLHFSPQMFDPSTMAALTATPGFLGLFVEEPRRTAAAPRGGRRLHLTPDTHTTITEMVAELREEWLSGTPSGTLLTRGLFLRVLIHLARLYATSKEPPSQPAHLSPGIHTTTVAAAVRYMDERFSEPIRIEQIAASVFLSPDRFTEVFYEVMGRTPRDYLRHLRLERACTLLRTTDASVTTIAQQAGFSEAAYFIRVFRTTLGMTPGAYRKRA